jgi:Flp pilus assembly protein TadD
MLLRFCRAPAAGAASVRSRILAPLGLAAVLALGACAQVAGTPEAALAVPDESKTPAAAGAAVPAPPRTKAALAGEAPSTPAASAALAEARARRLAGEKAAALALLDKAAAAHPKDRPVAKERAFLAAELGRLADAEPQLRRLADPKAAGYEADWRVHSAYGAALSAAGRQPEARLQLARALELAPEHPSVLNNLALSYVLEGRPAEAEKILRGIAQRSDRTVVKQNLAMVVGLSGRGEEARRLAEQSLPPAKAKANAERLAELARQKAAPPAGAAPVAAAPPHPDATPPGAAAPQRSAKAEPPWQSSLFNLGGPRQD